MSDAYGGQHNNPHGYQYTNQPVNPPGSQQPYQQAYQQAYQPPHGGYNQQTQQPAYPPAPGGPPPPSAPGYHPPAGYPYTYPPYQQPSAPYGYPPAPAPAPYYQPGYPPYHQPPPSYGAPYALPYGYPQAQVPAPAPYQQPAPQATPYPPVYGYQQAPAPYQQHAPVAYQPVAPQQAAPQAPPPVALASASAAPPVTANTVAAPLVPGPVDRVAPVTAEVETPAKADPSKSPAEVNLAEMFQALAPISAPGGMMASRWAPSNNQQSQQQTNQLSQQQTDRQSQQQTNQNNTGARERRGGRGAPLAVQAQLLPHVLHDTNGEQYLGPGAYDTYPNNGPDELVKQWCEERGIRVICVRCHALGMKCSHTYPCRHCSKDGEDCYLIFAAHSWTSCRFGINCDEMHEFHQAFYEAFGGDQEPLGLTADQIKEWIIPPTIDLQKAYGLKKDRNGKVSANRKQRPLKGCLAKFGERQQSGYKSTYPPPESRWLLDLLQPKIWKEKRVEIERYWTQTGQNPPPSTDQTSHDQNTPHQPQRTPAVAPHQPPPRGQNPPHRGGGQLLRGSGRAQPPQRQPPQRQPPQRLTAPGRAEGSSPVANINFDEVLPADKKGMYRTFASWYLAEPVAATRWKADYLDRTQNTSSAWQAMAAGENAAHHAGVARINQQQVPLDAAAAERANKKLADDVAAHLAGLNQKSTPAMGPQRPPVAPKPEDD